MRVVVVSVLVLGALAARSSAQPGVTPIGPRPMPAPPPGATVPAPRAHAHEGFYLRLQAAVGGLTIGYEGQGDTSSVHGGGFAISLAAGVSVAPNVVLFAELFDHGVDGPTVEAEGIEVEQPDETIDYTGLGAGLAWFPRDGWSVAGTLALASLSFDDDVHERHFETDAGPAIVLQVAREWWVSDAWALGASLRLLTGRIRRDEPDVTTREYAVTAASLGFVATYD